MVVLSLIQKNGKNHARDVSETTETIGEEVNRMKHNKDYFTGMKHLADAINYELDKKSLHNEMIKAKYLDDDYYEGVAKGLKEAHSIVHKVLSMQLEVKGEEDD